MRVKWRVVWETTAVEHRECKKWRWLGQEFSCVGEALVRLINAAAQLKRDWREIHIRLVRGKEEGGGKKAV